MRVLVCGGRDYDDFASLKRNLDSIFHQYGGSNLIHGDARGADRLSARWAKEHDSLQIRVHSFPADWQSHGKAAGHIRNRQMLIEGKPDLVVAFPGGRGTANMVQLAREAGVKVIEVDN